MSLAENLKKETGKYILAGVAVAAGLAWNDAMRKSIKHSIPMEEDSVKSTFVYALVITAILVFLSYVVSRMGVKTKQCVCAENDEVKKIALELNEKIDRVIYSRGLDKLALS